MGSEMCIRDSIWGGGFIATDGALDALSPFYIMMIRFMGAAILPCILCFKKLKNLEGYIWRRGLFAGALLFLAFSFQTIGLQYTTPSKNAFLTAVNVVMVPYLLWLYMRKKPNQKEVLASIVCVIGIAFLTLKPDAVGLNIGDMLSIICAFFFFTLLFIQTALPLPDTPAFFWNFYFFFFAASSFISRALSLTLSVISTPPSIRDSSSTVSAVSSRLIFETVAPFETAFSIR